MNEETLPEWFKSCRYCNQRIGFNPKIRSASGTLVPLEAWGDRHRCANSDYQRRENAVQEEQPSKEEVTGYFNDERLALSAIQYVQGINNRLNGFQLTIKRIPKTEGQTTLG